MKYKIRATQIIHKYFEVEANDKEDALEKAQDIVYEGDVHFDDEPFMKTEVNVDVL